MFLVFNMFKEQFLIDITNSLNQYISAKYIRIVFFSVEIYHSPRSFHLTWLLRCRPCYYHNSPCSCVSNDMAEEVFMNDQVILTYT